MGKHDFKFSPRLRAYSAWGWGELRSETHGVLDVGDKEESSLEIAEPILIKVRDLFLRIRKKIGPTACHEATEQIALTIAASGEKEAPALKKRTPSQKGKEKDVNLPSLTTMIPLDPKK